MHTRVPKVTWYGKTGDQLKENKVKWNERLQKFDDFHEITCVSDLTRYSKKKSNLIHFDFLRLLAGERYLLANHLPANQSACAKSTIHLCGIQLFRAAWLRSPVSSKKEEDIIITRVCAVSFYTLKHLALQSWNRKIPVTHNHFRHCRESLYTGKP